MLWFSCLSIIILFFCIYFNGIVYSIRRFFNPELPSLLSGEDKPLGDFIGNLLLSTVGVLIAAGIPFVFICFDYQKTIYDKHNNTYRYYYQQGYKSYISEEVEKSPPYWINSYNRAWLNGYSSRQAIFKRGS